MITLYVLSALCLLLSLSQVKGQTQVYMSQSTTVAQASQTGTATNPFSNLTLAFQSIKSTGGDIIFQEQTFEVKEQAAFTTSVSNANLIINMVTPADFTLKFSGTGTIRCTNFLQLVTAALVKNVAFNMKGVNIVAQSTAPLFTGDCNFTLQNIYMKTISSSLLVLGSEGNVILRNFRIDNIMLTASQIFIDHESRDRLEADYLMLDNVYFNNEVVNADKSVFTMIKSFVQYSYIEVKDSFMKGVGFSIKGEKIGGNEKTNIKITNTTMRDTTTFFFIESFGVTTIQDTKFLNATDRALHFFLTDENLSPNQTVITNCTFQDNKAELEGGALAFQGSKETSYQFSLVATIINSTFKNNYALLSGGAFAFLLLKNGNLTVVNSTFDSNIAAEGGGVFHVDKGEKTMSITFRNNTFNSNSAFTGGVFNFEFMDGVTVALDNNSYTNNVASFEGGVGFLSESQITLSDKNSNSSANKANFEGGAWSLKGVSDVRFENVKFEDTSSFLRGGCIFNNAAALTLKGITFKNCLLNAIGSNGGALFISEDATIDVKDTTFTNNQAEYGASVVFQSTKGTTQTFDTIKVTFDLEQAGITATIKSQIESANGGLVLKNVQVPALNTPFLSHTSGSLVLQDINIKNVKCLSEDDSLTFCILDFLNAGTTPFTVTIEKLAIDTVNSQVPLIETDGPTLSMKTVKITNIISTAETSVGDLQNSIVKIEDAEFLTIDSDFIMAANSEITVLDTIFNNEQKVLEAASKTSSQFFGASGSRVTIKDSEFKSNSKIYAESGGAVMLSNPKNVELTNVNFENNKAIYGGALFIEGTKIVGTITGCTFTKNSAKKDITEDITPGFGGAIYFQKDEDTVVSSRLLADDPTFVIDGVTFTENSAYTGGAIFTRDINFLLKNDNFLKNSAVSGGALATEINQASLLIYIQKCKFIENQADLYGASLLQLRQDVTKIDTDTVIENGKQKYDRGAPAKLRLRTFNYNDDLLLETERQTDDLLARKLITLDYDSFKGQALRITGVTSGGILSELLEIAVYDASNHLLDELAASDGNVSLSIIGASYPAKSTKNESSLAGITTKDLNNGSVTFLEDMNIFAFPESLLTIQAAVAITHKRLGNLNYLLTQDFEIELQNCQIGEIFREDTVICDPCKPDFFSLKDPFQTKICEKCDDSRATCPGGMEVYPKAGFWRIGELSDNVVECPNLKACLGGNLNNITNSTGFCAEGYTGNACATCETGWGKFGDNEQCTNCKTDKGYYAKLFVLLAIQVSLIVFNVYSNLGLVNKRTPEDFRKEEITIYQSTVIKVLVDYAQVLGIVASIDITWPGSLGDFGSVVSKSVPSSKDAFSLDCFFSLSNGSNENLFFYKILAVNIQPFLYFTFGTLFWIILAKVRKQSLRNNTQFRDNILVTNTLIAYVLQPEIVKTTLQLFKCKNLGPTDDPENFLEKDMEVECGSRTHLVWALGLGVPSLVLWLVLPVLVFTKVMLKVDKYNDDATMNRYHFIFKRYKKDKIYWDLSIIMRKALLIIFLVFLSDLYSQIFFSFAVFIFSLHLHYKKRPYLEESLNDLETLGLISNCFLLFGGLFFIEDEDFGVVHGFLLVIAFLANLIFLFKVVKAFWLVFKHKAKTAITMIKGKLGKSPRHGTTGTPKVAGREDVYKVDGETPKDGDAGDQEGQKEGENQDDQQEEEKEGQQRTKKFSVDSEEQEEEEEEEEDVIDEIPIEPGEAEASREDSLVLVSAKNKPKVIAITEGPEDPDNYDPQSRHRDI